MAIFIYIDTLNEKVVYCIAFYWLIVLLMSSLTLLLLVCLDSAVATVIYLLWLGLPYVWFLINLVILVWCVVGLLC